MKKEWLETGDALCNGCGMVFSALWEEDACIVDDDKDEHYCAECAENIRRGKELLSSEQREDLREARKKNCAKCGKRLPLGRHHLFCRACSDAAYVRFFGQDKFREMVLDRERRANG